MSMKTTIQKNQIHLGQLRVTLQRTLRIPDDGGRYPLPPGLGAFPLKRVEDCPRAPAEWRAKGGVMVPMYAREAMWLHLQGPSWRPYALKVGVGKVCAITGKLWTESLSREKQDYVVTPRQPWLDGIATGEGTIRQFVATALGHGHTVEGQVTGEETVGGLQLKAFAGRASRFGEHPPQCSAPRMRSASMAGPPPACAPAAPGGAAMGLGAGGRMKQKIYPDPYGVDAFDTEGTRIFVHLVHALRWRELTGEEPPATPVTSATYAQHGLPWFDLYDDHLSTLAPTTTLQAVKSLGQIDAEAVAPEHLPTEAKPAGKVIALPVPEGSVVSDGDW